MKNQALVVALLPLLTGACGVVEDTQSNPQTQTTTAALSSNDPIIGQWCYPNWGCIEFNSSGYAYQLTNSDYCWHAGDTVYGSPVVSTGTDANGNPTYSGTRNWGGSASRCYDARQYSATLVVKMNPTTNKLELIETVQLDNGPKENIWISSP